MNTASNTLVGFDLDELADEVSGNASDSDRVLQLAPEQCYCEDQVRTVFDESDIKELSETLKNTGQQQAIVVYPPDEEGRYKIDKGERRWRAAKNIEGFKLKAIVDIDAPGRDRQHKLLGQLVENDSRVDLPIIDMANALGELIELGYTQEDIAIKLGWIAASNKPNINKVCRILSILKLPEEGITLVKERIVTDLVTLELFRKLHEANNDRFSELCDLSRENEGISRKEVEAKLKEVKNTIQPEKSEKSDQNIPETQAQQESSSRQEKESVPQNNIDDNLNNAAVDNNNLGEPTQQVKNEVLTPADVKVESHDGRKGVLVLNMKPEHNDEVYVAFNSEEILLIKLNDLKLHSIQF